MRPQARCRRSRHARAKLHYPDELDFSVSHPVLVNGGNPLVIPTRALQKDIVSRPVCITGMHRSGTSLLAMLLDASGLYMGRPRNFARADADNQRGYWEDLRFVRLNDRLLRRAGGAWDKPPTAPLRSTDGLSGLVLRLRARHLLRQASGHEHWGWKDPRAALTLPFWLDLEPEMKVVICLRHPADVAASLARRLHWRSDDGMALWRTYNERLLDAVPRRQRIIVDNDLTIRAPEEGLARIHAFLGLPWNRSDSAAVSALVSPHLQRPAASDGRLCDADTEALYRRMRDEAGAQNR